MERETVAQACASAGARRRRGGRAGRTWTWTSTRTARALQWATWALLPAAAAATSKVCLAVYQMADNDLEYFIRNDNLELIESCAVRQANLETHVYFDSRNPTGNRFDDVTDPLESVYTADGSALLKQKYDGSMYLTWRHDLKKMVLDRKLDGERNGDSPQTVYDFLTHALASCVANGAAEYVLVFSSHGGGFYGFGGDDNVRRRRLGLAPADAPAAPTTHTLHTEHASLFAQRSPLQRRIPLDSAAAANATSSSSSHRRLVQSNTDLAGAIVASFQDTPGAPSRADVLGFDACLMMSVSAAYSYRSAARYYLASEATEPGTGWAYRSLCDTSSALALATELHRDFLEQKQGLLFHQAPKTLALVDTDLYLTFHDRLEDFGSAVKAVLSANNDAEFFALLQRSRASAVSFDSVLDNPGTDEQTAMDVGSFLAVFNDLCGPKFGTDVRKALDALVTSYDLMFVRRGNGPGTAPATGMHVMWPKKSSYVSKNGAALFDTYLFQNAEAAGTAPMFYDMVHTFVNSGTPTPNTRGSTMIVGSASTSSSTILGESLVDDGGTCAASAFSDVLATRDGQLLLNPTLEISSIRANGIATVRSDLATSTDDVVVEYGIDGTDWLFLPYRRRMTNVNDRHGRRMLDERERVLQHWKRNAIEVQLPSTVDIDHTHTIVDENKINRAKENNNDEDSTASERRANERRTAAAKIGERHAVLDGGGAMPMYGSASYPPHSLVSRMYHRGARTSSASYYPPGPKSRGGPRHDFPPRPPTSLTNATHQQRRRAVKEGYLFVYGGSVRGKFDGSSFSASGARGFYFLRDDDNFTPIYINLVPSDRDGSKFASIPVVYFPPGVDITSEDLTYETTPDDGVHKLGGRLGALQFGLDESELRMTTSFVLMTNDSPDLPNSTITETPPSAGGRIVPIVYVDGMADGYVYTEVLGGVDGTVLEWNNDNSFSLQFLRPEDALQYFGLVRSLVLIDMYAYDYDLVNLTNPVKGKGYDFFRFEAGIDASAQFSAGVAASIPSFFRRRGAVWKGGWGVIWSAAAWLVSSPLFVVFTLGTYGFL